MRIIKEPLGEAIKHVEEEARMILPGIQALFGFQLIAVFNQRFSELDSLEQSLHFMALLLSALSILLVLTPAAYHRLAEPRQISNRLFWLGTICLTLSLFPLCLGISFEVLVIAQVLKYTATVSVIFSVLTFILLFSAWFIFPKIYRHNLK